MTALAWPIPVALLLGGLGLGAFLWSLRSGQFDDLEGAAYRILEDDPDDAPGGKRGEGKPAGTSKEDTPRRS
jgi:cbb3-type cytochrome oxidase maturation protein